MPSCCPPPLSVAEVVARTGIPRTTVHADIARGRLPAHKLSGRTGAYLITQADLQEWGRLDSE
jgi:excisionase family DNA binding protein